MSDAVYIRPSENQEFFSRGSSNQVLDEIQSIHDEIERAAFGLFQQRDNERGSELGDWLQAESNLLKPVSISIKDDKDHLTVTADVPVFSMGELKVHVEGQELRVCGKSENSKIEDKEGAATSRRVCCSILLPTAVKAEDSSATLDKGVLTLTLPKAQPAKEIAVKAAA